MLNDYANNTNSINKDFDKKPVNINTQQMPFTNINTNNQTHNNETKSILGVNFYTENELNEIQMIVADDLETISLKPPNQVYFELYKVAREKAKLAKRNVIVAYLEAKNIKKTYMLDNLNDSDSDFDAEIEEVSESELDDL